MKVDLTFDYSDIIEESSTTELPLFQILKDVAGSLSSLLSSICSGSSLDNDLSDEEQQRIQNSSCIILNKDRSRRYGDSNMGDFYHIQPTEVAQQGPTVKEYLINNLDIKAVSSRLEQLSIIKPSSTGNFTDTSLIFSIDKTSSELSRYLKTLERQKNITNFNVITKEESEVIKKDKIVGTSAYEQTFSSLTAKISSEIDRHLKEAQVELQKGSIVLGKVYEKSCSDVKKKLGIVGEHSIVEFQKNIIKILDDTMVKKDSIENSIIKKKIEDRKENERIKAQKEEKKKLEEQKKKEEIIKQQELDKKKKEEEEEKEKEEERKKKILEKEVLTKRVGSFQEEYEEYIKKYEIYFKIYEEINEDASLSSLKRDKRKINTKISQLNIKAEKLNSVFQEILQIINKIVESNSSSIQNSTEHGMSKLEIWIFFTIATSAINQIESEVSIELQNGVPIAKLLFLLLCKFPNLKGILMSVFVKNCPLIIGYSCDQSNTKGRKIMGWRVEKTENGDSWESKEFHEDRVGGIFAVWSLVSSCSAAPAPDIMSSLNHFSKPVVPQITISSAWTTVSRILNTPKEKITRDHLRVLDCWTITAANVFYKAYGKQGLKLFKAICTDFTKGFEGPEYSYGDRLQLRWSKWEDSKIIDSLDELK